MDAGFLVLLIAIAFVVFIIAGTGLRIVRPWEKGLRTAWQVSADRRQRADVDHPVSRADHQGGHA